MKMVKALHVVMFCVSLIGAESQLNEFPELAHRHDKLFDHQPHMEFLEGPTYHPVHRGRIIDNSPIIDYYLKKRRLLRSDLGKRMYDSLSQQDAGDVSPRDVTLSTEVLTEMEGDREKRSNEDIWKLWHVKEGWKKRPMLRGDLGKRQMIRGDLG